uniref:Uncharacterized protein n=1 Tax=Plectus sambesii TaxID=2011161 RepID=A0A914X6F7_9BILA
MSQPYGYANQPPYNPNAPPPAGWAPPPAGGYPNQQGGFVPPPMPHFQAPPPAGGYEGYTEEGRIKQDFGFSDKSVRAGFIRKVFTLVTIMLAVVAGMVALALIHQPTNTFIRRTPGLYYASYATFMVVYIVLMCCESVRRRTPANLICLAILTLAIGYMTMMITAMYNVQSVLMALGITVGCCAGIIIFSMQTKHDLTSCMGVLCIIGLVMFFFGIVAIIVSVTTGARWLYLVYAGLAALLFMAYLAVDIQMIMGGRKYEISPEDYIFAAIQVFIDIVYIFWMLLSVIGGSSRN